jgi:3-oxo-5-alpha-steroid 4-dehydrogenase 1
VKKEETDIAEMSLIQDWLPPSPGNWTLIVNTFTYFPVVRPHPHPSPQIEPELHFKYNVTTNSANAQWQITAVQWLTAYYPMGKTSTNSCLNIPGKLAWILMELPAPFLLVYTMTGLRAMLPPPPRENLVLAGIYVCHLPYQLSHHS